MAKGRSLLGLFLECFLLPSAMPTGLLVFRIRSGGSRSDIPYIKLKITSPLTICIITR